MIPICRWNIKVHISLRTMTTWPPNFALNYYYFRGGIQLQRYQHQNALAEAYYEVFKKAKLFYN